MTEIDSIEARLVGLKKEYIGIALGYGYSTYRLVDLSARILYLENALRYLRDINAGPEAK